MRLREKNALEAVRKGEVAKAPVEDNGSDRRSHHRRLGAGHLYVALIPVAGAADAHKVAVRMRGNAGGITMPNNEIPLWSRQALDA